MDHAFRKGFPSAKTLFQFFFSGFASVQAESCCEETKFGNQLTADKT